MDDLRLILLVTGFVLIGAIYFFETSKTRSKKRTEKRRETVSLQDSDSKEAVPHVHISKRSEDPDLSLAISELNEVLAEGRRMDEEIASDVISNVANQISSPSEQKNIPETQNTHEKKFSGEYQNIVDEQVLCLFITAAPENPFTGGEILDAVNEAGLEYGEMNIFHHFGLGEHPLDRPIFSLADMYKPGSFDMENIALHRTKGLTLFMCLPLPIDKLIVFELMLNTSARLAEILSGTLRGGDHRILDDQHLAGIRDVLSS